MTRLEDEYRPETYGDRIADIYDDDHGRELRGAGTDEVEFLARLAKSGPALELGIGTGRVALPLQQQGVEVHGIDASERMIEKLRSKPGGRELPISISDMSKVDSPASEYRLIYVVEQTFFGLTTQQAQVDCFMNVYDRLKPGGRFLIHAFVPDLERGTRHQSVEVKHVGVDVVETKYSMLDPVEQFLKSQRVIISDGRVETYPEFLRYCWPSELDLMAKLANLNLEHRWADWAMSEFNSTSGSHVSVYRKTD